MVHVNIVVVEALVYELILFQRFCHLSDAVAITVLLDLDAVHLHFQGIVNVADIIPCVFYERCMHEVELLVDVETRMVDPIVIEAIEG